MIVLGVSALYHDSAAALVKDGEIIAAVQEERFTRIKHDSHLPANAIKYCLNRAGITSKELDAVVFYDNPFLTLNRFAANLCYTGRDSTDLINLSLESMLSDRIRVKDELRKLLGVLGKNDTLYATRHHIAHAASAFYPSPYNKAAIITVDGVGEWTTTSIGFGDEQTIRLDKEIEYPHSLGLLYSAFTYFCGFKVNFGDYKLMGLAPYGEPVYKDMILNKLIDVKDDGSFRLNLDYFDFQNGRSMTNEAFAGLFGGERRTPESRITKRETDMAASVQAVVEEVMLKLARHAKELYGETTDNLVMAGGVALNCVANGKILRENIFKKIWVQPAAGDAGGALGAALYYTHQIAGVERSRDNIHDIQKGSYLGCEFTDNEIREFLEGNNYKYSYCDNESIFDALADMLVDEKVIGIFEGRMEYGPRALGNRSIIGDARSERMQSKLNLKIKYRESFRPFAPAVLKEKADEYFDISAESPYMLMCADVKESIRNEFNLVDEIGKSKGDLLQVVNHSRSVIPAVTHVDYSARIQTVSEDVNPFFYRLIKAFEDKTGCAVLINTSFNVRGEPIVCTPYDAYMCFMRTEMDVLVLGNYILLKEEQAGLVNDENWRNRYELD